MQRLISLFHEPDDDYAPSKPSERPPSAKPIGQPLYYLALISYFEEQRHEADLRAARKMKVQESAQLVGAESD